MTSWKDRIENIELTITTGDGKKWTPLWIKSSRDIEYNVDGFEAISIEGTFVDRRRKKGEKIPITLYFSGEDCIDTARAFEISARDRRSWIFKHPYFDTIKVQPTKLRFDYSDHNVVKITGTLWETISQKFPRENLPPANLVSKGLLTLYPDVELTFVELVVVPEPVNITPSINFINTFQNTFEQISELKEDIANLKELARKASAAAQNMVNDATTFIQYTNDLIVFPLLITQNVTSKITAMLDSLDNLKTIFFGVPEAAPAFYEALATTMLGSLSDIVVNGDYDNDTEVFNSIERTTEAYNGVRSSLDEISYIQDPNLALQLDVIINTAIGSLYQIAFDARRQRTILISEDTNLILLAHKYYGPGDDNIDEFILQNQIKGDEYLQLKKGREIIYFV